MSDQLQVIGPNGDIQFHLLDVTRGVTTIGHAPGNDLQIDSPTVPEYAATLDHRSRPYTIMAMGADGLRINGQTAAPLQPLPLGAWDSAEIDGYMLVIAEDLAAVASAAAPAAVAAAATAAATAAAVPAAGAATVAVAVAAAPPPIAVVSQAAPGTAIIPVQAALATPGELPVFGHDIPARGSDLIFTAVRQRVQTIDGGQVAVWELEVTNASRYVSEFDITLEGPVPPHWVTISPGNFNLIEREQKTIAITISPPRQASTLAGRYNFAIVVASDEVRGAGGTTGAVVERAVEPAMLVVNPFFEFAVDPPQPESAQARYRQRSTLFALPIRNNGNSSVRYRIEAADTSSGCTFQYFDAQGVPLESRSIFVGPLQPTPTPVMIQATPIKRRVIGAGPRTYDLAFTVTPIDGVTLPFATRARLAHHALFGRWVLALLMLLTAILLLILFRPRVREVTYAYTDPATGAPALATLGRGQQAVAAAAQQSGPLAALFARFPGAQRNIACAWRPTFWCAQASHSPSLGPPPSAANC